MPPLLSLSSIILAVYGIATLASPLVDHGALSANTAVHVRDEWQPSAESLACLYMTNEINWAGEGVNLCEIGGTCGDKLPDGLAANVSSAGPEAGVTCFLFSEQNCAGDRSAPLVNPGYSDLEAIDFDKKAQSWKCWKWCGWMGTSSAASSSSAASFVSSSSLLASTVRARDAQQVTITTTIDASAQTATTAPGLPVVSSSTAPTAMSSSISSRPQIFETSMTTIVVTHTFADGSTILMSTPLALPIPVASIPSEVAAGAVSITQTDGQTLEGPMPFPTPGEGVSITTTFSATEPTSTEAGIAITTTQQASSPVSVSLASSFSSAPSSAASPEASEGWTSLVTLTGVDATLTVTATGGAEASSTSRSGRGMI